MKRRDFVHLAVFAGALGVSACDTASAPEDPVWGKQPCAHCSMIVGDRHYAAQLIDKTGTHLHFDDIGCMVTYLSERRISGENAWVRHEAEDRWLDAGTARYRGGARTPMNYGFVASTEGPLDYARMRTAVLEKGGGAR